MATGDIMTTCIGDIMIVIGAMTVIELCLAHDSSMTVIGPMTVIMSPDHR